MTHSTSWSGGPGRSSTPSWSAALRRGLVRQQWDSRPRDIKGAAALARGYDHDDPSQSDAMADRSWPQPTDGGLVVKWPARAIGVETLLGLVGLVLTLSSLAFAVAGLAADAPTHPPALLLSVFCPGHRRWGVLPGRPAWQP